MKKALALTVALGVALPVAAAAQESTTQSSSAKVAKAPAKPVSPPKKTSTTRNAGGSAKGKAAQVPSQVSAGSPSAAAEKREARTADGPASAENSIDVSKKYQAKKKKTTGTQPEEKNKPQS